MIFLTPFYSCFLILAISTAKYFSYNEEKISFVFMYTLLCLS